VTAVGVGFPGPLEGPLVIESLALQPWTPPTLLATVWREWTGYEGLGGHSSNFVIGGSPLVRPLVRPVPAAAAFVGLALVLYAALVAVRRRRWDGGVAVGLLLAGWLALDARWQLDLLRQLRLTRQRYGGKSWTDKRLAAEDGELFRFVSDLRRHLPAEPQVVYVLTRDPEGADRYLQLRSRYHLLPHNVCSSYATPPASAPVGSYLLVFNPRSDVAFDAGAGRLRWDRAGHPLTPGDGRGRSLPVTRVYSAPLGTLYRRR
jgi:hypothetical protein